MILLLPRNVLDTMPQKSGGGECPMPIAFLNSTDVLKSLLGLGILVKQVARN